MGSILIYVCKLMYVCIHGQCPRAHSILDYVHDLDEEEEEFRTVEARRGVRAHTNVPRLVREFPMLARGCLCAPPWLTFGSMATPDDLFAFNDAVEGHGAPAVR